MDEAELLGVDPSGLDDVLEHFERRTYEGREYRALSAGRHGIERGTVLIGDTAVRGFPSVPRALVLDPGVERHFDRRIAVEEKLDGCNVRVARVEGWSGGGGNADRGARGGDAGVADPETSLGGDESAGIRDAGGDADDADVFAFTRSGYVCPYATSRARDLVAGTSFFADHPELMLCAELIGPETPYTTHAYDGVESDELRVFDVRDRTTGEPLSVSRRRDRCESYGFPQPRLFGVWGPGEAVPRIGAAIDELAAERREGVVMQSVDGDRLLKYTAGPKHRDELAYGFSQPHDVGRDYVFSRVMREAYQAAEREDEGDALRERAHELGESILLPAVEAIHDVERGDPLGSEHTVRGDPETVSDLLDHLADLGVRIEIREDRTDADERVVSFLKVSETATDQVRAYLEGTTVDE